MAQYLGSKDDNTKNVELSGLFSEIGKMFIILYKNLHAADDERINEQFLKTYHLYLAEIIVEILNLPAFLKQMVFFENLVVQENCISLAGITLIAVHFVGSSFHNFNNHLVIEELPLPLSCCDENLSLVGIIEQQFNTVELGKYLRIIKKKERLLPEYESKKKK